MTLVLRYAARSDRGLIRGNNQDSVYAGPRLLAVADGMGGHAAGDVASKVVIAALEHLDDDAPSGDLLQSMREAVFEGSEHLREVIRESPTLNTAHCRPSPSPALTSATPATVVPMPSCSGWLRAEARMLSLARPSWRTSSGTSRSSRPARADRASTVSALATSPAAWPPMPSATASTGRSARKESSLSLRTRPTSVAEPTVTRMPVPSPESHTVASRRTVRRLGAPVAR